MKVQDQTQTQHISEQNSPAPILLVEDNSVSQKLTVHILEQAGYRCDVATNGREAIEAVSRIPYGVILMDCLMPEMDGFEATAAIRSHEREHGGHVPILAMTANPMHSSRQRCFEAGMDDYISQPVKPEDLIALLEKWLHQKSESSEGPRPSELPPEPPAVDLAAVRDIAGDNRAFLMELIQEFLERTPAIIATLKTALNQADTMTAQREVHNIIESAGIFRATSFREIAFPIEQLILQGELAAASNLLKALEEEWRRVEQSLKTLLNE